MEICLPDSQIWLPLGKRTVLSVEPCIPLPTLIAMMDKYSYICHENAAWMLSVLVFSVLHSTGIVWGVYYFPRLHTHRNLPLVMTLWSDNIHSSIHINLTDTHSDIQTQIMITGYQQPTSDFFSVYIG
jgi:hypothetical protein